MAHKWTLASNATAGDRLTNIGNAAVHLSTGDMVQLVYDPSLANPLKYTLQLVPGTAHTTPASIATINCGPEAAGGPTFSSAQALTICRDASDNIYVVGQNGDSNQFGGAGANIIIQAFTKGTGLTWSAQVASVNPFVAFGQSGTGLDAVWCNTGGGTNTKGHLAIMCHYTAGGGTYYAVVTYDAGLVLTGQNNSLVSYTGHDGAGAAALYPRMQDIAQAGFGAASGLVIHQQNTNPTIEVYSWSVPSSGIPTATFGTTLTAGTLSATTKATVHYMGAGNGYACVYPSNTSAGQMKVQFLTTAGATTGTATNTGVANNFPAPSASLSWDASVAPNATLWVYGWSSAAATTMLRQPWTLSGGAATLGTIVTDDTAVGAGGTNTTLRCVVNPIDNTHTDYQTFNTNGATLALLGDFSLLPGPTNAPTLVTPTNNDIEYLAGGYTFDWTFSSPQFGDAQVSYALKRQASGGAVEWYTAAAGGSWGASEVFNTSGTDGVVFPASKWTVGTTYTWAVATKGAAGVAGPYSSLWTIYSAQALPTTPSMTATYQAAPNNRVALVLTGTSVDTCEVQVSRDGGVTWADVRGAGAIVLVAGAATVYDYEAQPGVVSSYRVRQINTSQAPYAAYSAWSATVTATPSLTTFWLRNPADGSLGLAVNIRAGSLNLQITENNTVHYPLGSSYPVVLADTLKGQDGSATFFTTSNADETALVALLSLQSTLLLQTNDNRQWYVRFISRSLAVPEEVGGGLYQEYAAQWVQVAAP